MITCSVIKIYRGALSNRVEFLSSVQGLPPLRVLSRLFVILREWISAPVIISLTSVVRSHACYERSCRVDITAGSNDDLDNVERCTH